MGCRHDLTRQYIYQWRHELRRQGMWLRSEGTVFLPFEHVAVVLGQVLSVGPERAPGRDPLGERPARCAATGGPKMTVSSA